jgi:hypothetical protein
MKATFILKAVLKLTAGAMSRNLALVLVGLSVILSCLTPSESLAASSSGGQIGFHLPILYRTRQVQITPGGQTRNDNMLDAVPALGWNFSELFFLGAAYRYTNETGTGDYKLSGGAYGPTVSLTAANFSLGLTYYLSGSLTEHSGGSDTIYSKGTGFDASVTYLFPVNGNFSWGPSFMYSDIKYTQTQYGSAAAVSNSYELSGIEPYLALYFNF